MPRVHLTLLAKKRTHQTSDAWSSSLPLDDGGEKRTVLETREVTMLVLHVYGRIIFSKHCGSPYIFKVCRVRQRQRFTPLTQLELFDLTSLLGLSI